MSRSLRNSLDSRAISNPRPANNDRRGGQQSAISNRRVSWVLLAAGCWLLAAGVMGCESFQRKFTRKDKRPKPAPTPIISFQDYSRAMTPLDRYRKHYAIFDYWNAELMAALEARTPNPKRIKLASTEALGELEAMRTLVTDEVAARFEPLLKERAAIDHELRRSSFSSTGSEIVRHQLESQTRQIHRELFWRKVQDQLKEQTP